MPLNGSSHRNESLQKYGSAMFPGVPLRVATTTTAIYYVFTHIYRVKYNLYPTYM